MKTSSAKAKGRRLASRVKKVLLDNCLEIQEADIVVTSSGTTGPDLMLSPLAKCHYPITIECKMQESLQIWAALKQARGHVVNETGVAALVFSRNRDDTYIALRLEDFMLLRRMWLGKRVNTDLPQPLSPSAFPTG